MNKNKVITTWLNANAEILIFFLSLGFSIGSMLFYYSTSLNLAYNDATSHLNISRRIIDSLTPSLVQVGSTWLPLLHLLELPFIYNNFLWHSGLAGGFVSMICFISSALLIYKFTRLLTKDIFSSVISVIIFISNANMLYMQTTAMFEPLLIVNLLGAVYFLFKWVKTDKIINLVVSAFFVMLGTLSRYDAWFVLLFITLYIGTYSLKKYSFSKVQGVLIIFIALASYGILLWFIYNLAIFGNPFYFAFNEYSAFAQQTALASKGDLPTKGNILLAFIFYTSSVILNQGLVMVIIASIGLIYFIFDKLHKIDEWAPFLLLSPYLFNIYALFKGHSVIWMPNFPPYFNTFFNIRYGLLVAPAIAIFIAYLSSKGALYKFIIIVAIILQIALFYSILPGRTDHLSYVILRDTVASTNEYTKDATTWLRTNYKGGLILISSASSESFIFNTGLDMKYFITEGTGKYWHESLRNPTTYAQWVIFFPSYTDRVGIKMKSNKDFLNNYQLAYKNQTYWLFEKRKDKITPIQGKYYGIRLDETKPEDYILLDILFKKIKKNYLNIK